MQEMKHLGAAVLQCADLVGTGTLCEAVREIAAGGAAHHARKCGQRARDVADEQGDDAAEDKEGDETDGRDDDGDVCYGGECLVMRDIDDDRPACIADRLGGEVHLFAAELRLERLLPAGHQACGEFLVFSAVHLGHGGAGECIVVVVDELALWPEDKDRAGLADLHGIKELHDIGEGDVRADNSNESTVLHQCLSERDRDACTADGRHIRSGHKDVIRCDCALEPWACTRVEVRRGRNVGAHHTVGVGEQEG